MHFFRILISSLPGCILPAFLAGTIKLLTYEKFNESFYVTLITIAILIIIFKLYPRLFKFLTKSDKRYLF